MANHAPSATEGDQNRLQTHEAIRSVASAVLGTNGPTFFQTLAVELQRATKADVLLIGKLCRASSGGEVVESLAVASSRDTLPPFSYSLEGTPCREVFTKKVCVFESGVAALFPNDSILQQPRAEGYVGLPILGPRGDVSGIVALVSLTPIEDADSIVSLLEIFAPLVASELDRSTAVQQKEETEQVLWHMLQQIHAVVYAATPDYSTIEFISPSVRELLGISAAELTADPKKWELLTHPDDKESVTEFFSTHLGTGSYGIDYRLRTSRDTVTWVRERIVEIGPPGKPIKLIGLIEDVSELHESTAELISARERAEIANRAKSAFIARVSHDFRTPLAGVVGALDLLADANLEEADKDLVNIAKWCSESLQGIIEEVLDLSRIEEGRVSFSPSWINIRDFAAKLIESISISRNFSHVTIDLLIEKETPLEIFCDQTRLQQVLANLLNNATKFTPPDGFIRLSIAAEAEEGIRFEVYDSGPGIPDESLSRVFEPFFSTDSTATGRGIGLGLSIASSLIRLMGGTVQLESKVGHFTRFTVKLPCEQRLDPSSPRAQLARKDDAAWTPREHYRILVVEDNPINQHITDRLLRKADLQVTLASDLKTARVALDAAEFDCIVLDLRLPDGDGLELLAQQRSESSKLRWANTPVVALTGLASPEDRAKCLASGAASYLTKPVTRVELYDALRQVLEP